MCINSDGSFACVCLTGYTGSGLTCTDINECDNLSTCNERATCTNTVGSFICACVPGTAGDGVNFCNCKKAVFFFSIVATHLFTLSSVASLRLLCKK